MALAVKIMSAAQQAMLDDVRAILRDQAREIDRLHALIELLESQLEEVTNGHCYDL